jgi:hypothetical protein
MVEKQKPEYDLVKRAAKLMTHPEEATPEDINIKRLAAGVMIFYSGQEGTGANLRGFT